LIAEYYYDSIDVDLALADFPYLTI
jgi:hypothetical protein